MNVHSTPAGEKVEGFVVEAVNIWVAAGFVPNPLLVTV